MSALDYQKTLSKDPYLFLADTDLRILSVFDDLYFDRADADILSPAMRIYAINRLKKIGFRQKTGTVLVHDKSEEKCLIPKFHALGASPFDITRYTPRAERDFYLLTPTQTACQFVDHYSLEDAVRHIEKLVAKQPINLYRMADYLERKPKHQEFRRALGYLKAAQEKAVSAEPLCRRRALG
ncbi:hypothetical protein KFE80_00240 [bacterium SCSIO 12696]|nr:hypothetical protein KFE80_00240 [bacterium SCSIO 12696]